MMLFMHNETMLKSFFKLQQDCSRIRGIVVKLRGLENRDEMEFFWPILYKE